VISITRKEKLSNREVKLDVYGKRQTAKIKLLPFLFSCVHSGVKLFVFAIKSRRRYSIFVWFIYGLEEKNSKAEVIFREVRHDVNGRRVFQNLLFTEIFIF